MLRQNFEKVIGMSHRRSTKDTSPKQQWQLYNNKFKKEINYTHYQWRTNILHKQLRKSRMVFSNTGISEQAIIVYIFTGLFRNFVNFALPHVIISHICCYTCHWNPRIQTGNTKITTSKCYRNISQQRYSLRGTEFWFKTKYFTWLTWSVRATIINVITKYRMKLYLH